MNSDNDCIQLELLPPELAVRKVSSNCHISFDHAYYSVPHRFYSKMVIVRATNSSIDILDSDGQCVASHNRSYSSHKYVTDPSHLPGAYYSLFYDNRFDGAKLRSWAKQYGNNTFQVIDTILQSKPFEEHAYKSCIAVLQLSKKYGSFILECACRTALSSKVYNFHAIHKIAKAEYDKNR